MHETQNATEETQYLTFHLASEEYAIGILRVKEIIPFGTLTKVPQTPPAIRGVINLRGSIVPVVDLALKFGLAASSVTTRTCIVIVEVKLDGEQTTMGIMADSVSQVIAFSTDDILPAPPFGTRVSMNFLIGMGNAGSKFVLILDIDKVLSAAELDSLAPQSTLATSPAPTEIE